MELGIHKAAHEAVALAFESQDFKLNSMDQPVKQEPLRDFLLEDHDIEKSQGVHVRKLGQVHETQRLGFRIKRRVGDALSFDFDVVQTNLDSSV